MGQLTNLYVSSSYQGLLKMTDSATGVTGTLQTVQTGDGTNTPLQISQTQVNISGSLTVNGAPISVNTGSLVTTSSFNAYTSSVDLHLAGLDAATGSLQLQINSKLNTSSFNSYTSSNDSKVNSLISQTGSYVTETESGSFMITGSVAGDTLTFTKGNGSQFSLQINTGSLPSGVVSGSAQVAAFGYATTSSVTSLSSSIATTDLNQNNVIAGLATTSSLTSLSSSIASTDLAQNNRLGSLETATGSLQNQINQKLDSSSFNSYTSSNNGRVSSLESKTGSYATTGSNIFQGNQTITGSLFVTNEITALSASITYLKTIFQTSSIVYSSGSNIFGDEASDVQTLNGSVKIPLGNLNITGATTSSLGFFGNLQGTASYAINALSASYAPTVLPSGVVSGSSQIIYSGITGIPSGIVSGSSQISYTGITNVPSGIISGSQQITNLGFATTSSVNQKLDTGSFNTYTASIDARTGSYITTGSAASIQSITGSLILSGSAGVELDVKGDQTITGSINVSGSVNFVGPVGLNLLQPDNFKQNLTLLGGINHFSSSTILTNYLNSITTSLNNNDNNFALPPGGGISSPAGIAIITGSVFISGSNNLILNLGSSTAAAAGRKQIYGSTNIGITAPTINTSSLTVPQINNNYQAGGLALTLTTGSNAGNNAHSFGSNINLSTITWNHPSASIGAGASSTVTSNVNVGTITSITTGPTILTVAAQVQNNVISNPSLALNHISSSIQFNQNIVGGNGLTFNNRYYQTGSNNFLAAAANIFAGQSLVVNAGGAPATNVSRTLVGNLIGGQTVNVSLEATGVDTGGLRNSLIYGQGLNVSGSHSAASTAVNNITLLGRWNGQDNGLADSARTVFAVGTGTADGTRRTGLYVTSGSLVGVSGSLDVKGTTSMTGSLDISGSLRVTGNIQFASGSDTTMGTFVLNGGNPGTATVSNTLVTANSLIYLTKQTNTNSGNGTVSVTSKGSGTFSVTSNHNGDADTVAYLIINPA